MARITQQSSIHTTGTSYENEPVIKSDAASSDVMEWAASTGTSKVEIREDASNNLKLEVDGVPVASGLAGIDGAGLHLDGATGLIDIPGSGSAPVVALGTKLSFEFIIQAHKWGVGTEYIFDFGTSGRTLLYNAGNNLALEIGGASGLDLGVDVLGDGKVHHLVLAIDGTSLKVYDNANEVASKTISAPTIDAAADGVLGARFNSSTTYCFNGTFYRARFWNKTLTAAEVTASFENATVPFADQYGSQTIVIPGDFTGNLDGWDASNDWNNQTNPSNNMVLAADATGQVCRTSTQLTAGKRYRCDYTATSTAGAPAFAFYNASSQVEAHSATVGSSTISDGTKSFEFVQPQGIGLGYFYIFSTTVSDGVTLDDVSVREIGCVADYDLAFAQPALSTLIQDRSNAADGVASSTGVTQVTPITQLNSTSARIGSTQLAAGTAPYIPADGELLADSVKVNPTASGSGEVAIDSASAYEAKVVFAEGGSNKWAAGNAGGSDAFVVGTGGNLSTPKVTISSAGLATFSNGIAFSSQTDTTVGTTTSTTLDAYEEGTFGGTSADDILVATTSGTITCGTWGLMSYTKVGRLVTIQGDIRVSAVSSPVGDTKLVLPFPVRAAGAGLDARASGGIFTANVDFPTGYTFPVLWVAEGYTHALIAVGGDGLAYDGIAVTTASSQQFVVNFSYETT